MNQRIDEYKKQKELKNLDKQNLYLTTTEKVLLKYIKENKTILNDQASWYDAIPNIIIEDLELMEAVLRWKRGETTAADLIHPSKLIRGAAERWQKLHTRE